MELPSLKKGSEASCFIGWVVGTIPLIIKNTKDLGFLKFKITPQPDG